MELHAQTRGFSGAACMQFSYYFNNPYVELGFYEYEASIASINKNKGEMLAQCNSTSCSDLGVSMLNATHGHYYLFAANPGPGGAIMHHRYTLFPPDHPGGPSKLELYRLACIICLAYLSS